MTVAEKPSVYIALLCTGMTAFSITILINNRQYIKNTINHIYSLSIRCIVQIVFIILIRKIVICYIA